MKQKIGLQEQKKKLKFNPYYFLALITLLITISSICTQYIANSYKYHPALGQPIYENFYWPWNWIVWSIQFSSSSPTFYEKINAVMALAMSVSTLLLFFFLMVHSRKKIKNDSLYGTAHWADEEEIERTGLLNKGVTDAIYIGGWLDKKKNQKYLRHSGPEHAISFAPTRSGKGIGQVLPTLLSWSSSVVVYDIKGENWALTSGWRQRYANNKVIKFEPGCIDGSGAKYNPLAEIRLGTLYEVQDTQNITTMIVDPDGKGLNDHWSKTGHAFLVGIILHSLYVGKAIGKTATLESVSDSLSDPNHPIEWLLDEMLSNNHDNGDNHKTIAQSARDMLNTEDEERSSIISTARSFFSLYRDPIVAMNTSRSDFKISDLMNFENPVSLYIVVSAKNKDTMKPLIRLIITQIIRNLTEKMEFAHGQPVKSYKHKLLLLIDEFPSLGKLAVFEDTLAFMASYGLKAFLIIQDLSQLYKFYTKDETIISNCHIRAAYAPNKIETAELLSKYTGTMTATERNYTSSGYRFSASLRNVSETLRAVQRPLLTPDECMRLPAAKKNKDGTKVIEAGDMLVFVAGNAPIYGKQILFFRDPIFLERSKIEPPPQSDTTIKIVAQRKPEKTNEEPESIEFEL